MFFAQGYKPLHSFRSLAPCRPQLVIENVMSCCVRRDDSARNSIVLKSMLQLIATVDEFPFELLF